MTSGDRRSTAGSASWASRSLPRPVLPATRAFSRDVIVDGRPALDLRVTVAWVAGIGCSLWAYYGLEAMEIPKRIYARMLRANFDYPFVKFAMTDDDRPMLMTELPTAALDRDELGRGLARLTVVADRLLEETANAVADRGVLPDWSDRNLGIAALLDAYRGGGRVGHAGLGATATRAAPARPDRPPPGRAHDVAAHRRSLVLLAAVMAVLALPGLTGDRRRRRSTRSRRRPRTTSSPTTGDRGHRPDPRSRTPRPIRDGQFSVFDEVQLAIHDEATEVTACDDGGAARRRRRGRGRRQRGHRRAARRAALRGGTIDLELTTAPRLRRPAAAGAARRWSSSRPGASAPSSEVSVAIPAGYEIRVDGDPLTEARAARWSAGRSRIRRAGWHSSPPSSPPSSRRSTPPSRSMGARPTSRSAPSPTTRPGASAPLALVERGAAADRGGDRPAVSADRAARPDRVGDQRRVRLRRDSVGRHRAPGRVRPAAVHRAPPGGHVWLSPELVESRWIREGLASSSRPRSRPSSTSMPPYDPAAQVAELADERIPARRLGCRRPIRRPRPTATPHPGRSSTSSSEAVGAEALRDGARARGGVDRAVRRRPRSKPTRRSMAGAAAGAAHQPGLPRPSRDGQRPGSLRAVRRSAS